MCKAVELVQVDLLLRKGMSLEKAASAFMQGLAARPSPVGTLGFDWVLTLKSFWKTYLSTSQHLLIFDFHLLPPRHSFDEHNLHLRWLYTILLQLAFSSCMQEPVVCDKGNLHPLFLVALPNLCTSPVCLERIWLKILQTGESDWTALWSESLQPELRFATWPNNQALLLFWPL